MFEDNAEFGLGMHVALETIRHRIHKVMEDTLDKVPNALAALYKDWIEFRDDRAKSTEIRDLLVPQLEANKAVEGVQTLLSLKQYLAKKSQWIFGGDGWAYDIGYGGLDHVIASGEDV